jgi:hypothetical protein
LARLTPARVLLLGVVAGALSLAACSKSGSSSVPAGATPTPTVSPTVGPSSTPPPAAAGIAYLPDAGNGGPLGITVAHFEEFTGAAYPYKPLFVNFRGSVRLFTIDTSNTTGLAVIKSTSGGYTLLQGVLGLTTASIFPGGNPYDTSVVPPSPAPTSAIIGDVTDENMIGNGIGAVGLSMGPSAFGILGVNQASTQTPTFNGFIGFPCKGRTPTFGSGYGAVATSPSTNVSSGNYSTLVRGPQALLSFSVAPNFGEVPPRYVFCYQVQDTALGANMLSTPGAAGHGLMSFSPIDPSRAFLGQVGTSINQVALVTGLPFAITRSSTLTLSGAGRVNSVAFAPNGQFAAVGTDAGLFIMSGVNTPTLGIEGQGANKSKGPYSPNYKGADGLYHPVKNVTSVGFSADGLFLAATVSLFQNSPGASSGGTLVVLPFNISTGILSAPAVVINNLPLNAYYQDIMTVR